MRLIGRVKVIAVFMESSMLIESEICLSGIQCMIMVFCEILLDFRMKRTVLGAILSEGSEAMEAVLGDLSSSSGSNRKLVESA